ncbi:hypothetical protein OHC33_009646 [Knufia fluminis]|uniref:NmrA-like domain-containing protein n=1 Tax=Knufia fluminis TaxID=191047 RepID=A0AAN8E9Q1_9EURO|nr:hypothetical protein OHC33_009646 [Knufia fluminis]
MAIKVALAGATGNLGPAALKALLEAGFEVTILSRKDSNSTDSLPAHPNQKVIKVDYNDVEDLRSALQGIDVVVSTLAATSFNDRKPLIDAALTAGVKRFLPSEFGSDMANPLNRKLPVFQGKVETQEYLEKLAKSHPDFTYTYTYNNVFLDWGLQVGFIMNPKEHKATLYDGDDVPISMTTLATVGKAVVGIIKNLDATKNRGVCFHDGVFTQKQLIELFKKIDGKEWTTEQASTVDIEKSAYEALKKGENISKTMVDFLYRGAFSRDHTPDFTGKVENELLGLKEMSEEEVIEVLKQFV